MLSRSVHSIFCFILGGKPLDSVSEEREEKEAWVFFLWWEVWGQSKCRNFIVSNCSFHCTGGFSFRKNNKIQVTTTLNGNLQLSSNGPRRKGNWLNLVRDHIATGNLTLSWVYTKAYWQWLVQWDEAVVYLGVATLDTQQGPLIRTFSLLAVYAVPAVSRDQLANHIKYPHSFIIYSLLS